MRIRKLLLFILTFAVLSGPLPAVTADAAPPPPIELVMLSTATLATAPDTGVGPELPPTPANPHDWFLDHLALAAVIAMVVQFLKKNVLKSLTGLATVAASLITGTVISVAATFNLPLFGQLHDRSLTDALLFGVEAAILASGGWDVIKGLIGLGKARSSAVT